MQNVYNVLLRLSGNLGPALQQINQAAQAAQRSINNLSNSLGGLQGSLGALIGTGGLVVALQSVAEAAARAEASVKVFAAIASRTGTDVDEAEEAVARLSDAFKVSETVVRDSLTQFLKIGWSIEQAEAAMALGASSALAYGTTTAKGFEAVAQSATTGLSSYLNFIGISENIGPMLQKVEAATANLSEEQRQQAKAQAIVNMLYKAAGAELETAGTFLEGYAGAQSDLARAQQQLAEQLGKLVLPTVIQFTQALTNAINIVKGLDEQTQRNIMNAAVWAAGIGGVTLAVGLLAPVISNAIGLFVGLNRVLLANPLLLVASAAAAAAIAFIQLGGPADETRQRFLLVAQSVLGAGNAVRSVVNALIAGLQGAFGVVVSIVENIGAAWDGFKNLFEGNFSEAAKKFEEINLERWNANLKKAQGTFLLAAGQMEAATNQIAASSAGVVLDSTARVAGQLEDFSKRVTGTANSNNKSLQELTQRTASAAQAAAEGVTGTGKAAVVVTKALIDEATRLFAAYNAAIASGDPMAIARASAALDAFKGRSESAAAALEAVQLAQRRTSAATREAADALSLLNDDYADGRLSLRQYHDAAYALLQNLQMQIAGVDRSSEQYKKLRDRLEEVRGVVINLREELAKPLALKIDFEAGQAQEELRARLLAKNEAGIRSFIQWQERLYDKSGPEQQALILRNLETAYDALGQKIGDAKQAQQELAEYTTGRAFDAWVRGLQSVSQVELERMKTSERNANRLRAIDDELDARREREQRRNEDMAARLAELRTQYDRQEISLGTYLRRLDELNREAEKAVGATQANTEAEERADANRRLVVQAMANINRELAERITLETKLAAAYGKDEGQFGLNKNLNRQAEALDEVRQRVEWLAANIDSASLDEIIEARDIALANGLWDAYTKLQSRLTGLTPTVIEQARAAGLLAKRNDEWAITEEEKLRLLELTQQAQIAAIPGTQAYLDVLQAQKAELERLGQVGSDAYRGIVAQIEEATRAASAFAGENARMSSGGGVAGGGLNPLPDFGELTAGLAGMSDEAIGEMVQQFSGLEQAAGFVAAALAELERRLLDDTHVQQALEYGKALNSIGKDVTRLASSFATLVSEAQQFVDTVAAEGAGAAERMMLELDALVQTGQLTGDELTRTKLVIEGLARVVTQFQSSQTSDARGPLNQISDGARGVIEVSPAVNSAVELLNNSYEQLANASQLSAEQQTELAGRFEQVAAALLATSGEASELYQQFTRIAQGLRMMSAEQRSVKTLELGLAQLAKMLGDNRPEWAQLADEAQNAASEIIRANGGAITPMAAALIDLAKRLRATGSELERTANAADAFRQAANTVRAAGGEMSSALASLFEAGSLLVTNASQNWPQAIAGIVTAMAEALLDGEDDMQFAATQLAGVISSTLQGLQYGPVGAILGFVTGLISGIIAYINRAKAAAEKLRQGMEEAAERTAERQLDIEAKRLENLYKKGQISYSEYQKRLLELELQRLEASYIAEAKSLWKLAQEGKITWEQYQRELAQLEEQYRLDREAAELESQQRIAEESKRLQEEQLNNATSALSGWASVIGDYMAGKLNLSQFEQEMGKQLDEALMGMVAQAIIKAAVQASGLAPLIQAFQEALASGDFAGAQGLMGQIIAAAKGASQQAAYWAQYFNQAMNAANSGQPFTPPAPPPGVGGGNDGGVRPPGGGGRTPPGAATTQGGGKTPQESVSALAEAMKGLPEGLQPTTEAIADLTARTDEWVDALTSFELPAWGDMTVSIDRIAQASMVFYEGAVLVREGGRDIERASRRFVEAADRIVVGGRVPFDFRR